MAATSPLGQRGREVRGEVGKDRDGGEKKKTPPRDEREGWKERCVVKRRRWRGIIHVMQCYEKLHKYTHNTSCTVFMQEGTPHYFFGNIFWLKLLITSVLKKNTYIIGVQTDLKRCFFLHPLESQNHHYSCKAKSISVHPRLQWIQEILYQTSRL